MNTQIQISNVTIRQNDNQLFNLNDLHKASGGSETHRPTFWLRNQQTQELIAEIEAEGKTAFTTSQGGKNRGTFVCKELVYAYATWISAKFFLLVIRTFDAAVSSSLKTQTALPNGLTLEQQDEIKKFHRQLVQAAPKEKQAKLAIQLWSSIKSKFGVSYKEVAPEHYPEVLSLMARVAVENATLTGELLDKPIQSTVRLEEFELIRVMEFLSNRYMEMQTASCVAHAIYPLNPQMAKNMKSEFDRDFPLLKGIAHTFQRFSGSLKDPLCAKEFEMHAKYLQGANLAW